MKVFHSRSGTLPLPRQIFKQPYKHQVYVKPQDTGYAKGIIHPKGTTRDLIHPRTFTPKERLRKSAAIPRKKYTEAELAKMPEEQAYKIKNSELRRKFLKESYESEQKRLEMMEQKHKKLAEERKKVEEEAQRHEKSRSELFTLPTVESYLNGPLIRQRTDEEKEELHLKREANRLSETMAVKERRASRLMELYNSSSHFAITEEKLQLLVDEAFSDRKLKEVSKLLSLRSDRMETVPTSAQFDNSLRDIILGNVNKGPSYEVVEDTLSGYSSKMDAKAAKLRDEKKQQLKKEAEEKQKKLQELQEEMIKDREDKDK